MTINEETTHKSLRQNVTPAIEDYLKAIYTLQQINAAVRTFDLAVHLGVKPPSVTSMLKSLANLNLIVYKPYQGVELTEAGKRIALEIVRHHRLIESFLVKALGYSWDEVHEEAEVLEHFISEKLEARIADYLGNPTYDPHGDPIPSLDGALPAYSNASLAEFPEKTSLTVTRIATQESEKLRYLAKLKIIPGAKLKIITKAPFDGPITIQIDKKKHAIDYNLAKVIIVDDEF